MTRSELATLLKRGRSRFKRSEPSKRTEDGITFDSIAELKRYRELKLLRAKGDVKWFIRQPLFDLAGVKYRADFLVVEPDVRGGVTISVEEVKGKYKGRFRTEALRTWTRNVKQVREIYGIDVELIER